MSFIASLPVPTRDEVLGRIRSLADTHADLAGHEEFELPYVTEPYWCTRA